MANYKNRLYQNFIRTVLTEGLNVNSWCAKDENNLATGIFLNKQKPLFKPCF